MAQVGSKFNRPEVNFNDICKGLDQLRDKLISRLHSKGPGSYASRHEVLGILEEEMLELKEAIRSDSLAGYTGYKNELLDVAVGAIFGYICMNSEYIEPPKG